MTVRELREILEHHRGDLPVRIYADGTFLISEAWHDRSDDVFAIQAGPEESAGEAR